MSGLCYDPHFPSQKFHHDVFWEMNGLYFTFQETPNLLIQWWNHISQSGSFMKFIHVWISSSYGVSSLGDQNYLDFWPKLNILKEKYHIMWIDKMLPLIIHWKLIFSTTKLKLHNPIDNYLICVKFDVHWRRNIHKKQVPSNICISCIFWQISKSEIFLLVHPSP